MGAGYKALSSDSSYFTPMIKPCFEEVFLNLSTVHLKMTLR